MKERTTHHAIHPQLQGLDPKVAPSEPSNDTGIEVHEETWSAVTAQHLYKMRCECGRSWFELELPEIVKCPACHKLGLVSHLA